MSTTSFHPSCAPQGSVPSRNKDLKVPLFIYGNPDSFQGISAVLLGFERITGENHASIIENPISAVRGRLLWVEQEFLNRVDFRGLIKGVNEGLMFHRFLATIQPNADLPAIERCWVYQVGDDSSPSTAATSNAEWVRDLHGQPKDDLLAIHEQAA